MGDMEMELPDNTFPMMTGRGPYGPLEMGGMFSVLKVRAGQKPGDYTDPGWYTMPPGTQASEWAGPLPPASAPSPAHPAAHVGSTHGATPSSGIQGQAKKPRHHNH
jgi:hypothetical protein